MRAQKHCRPKSKKFTLAEARRVKAILDPRDKHDLHEFHVGLNVELEHHDLTCGDPIETGMIAIRHMNEVHVAKRSPRNYYPLLLTKVEGEKWPKR
jgi:hypothetical protein